MNKYAHRDAGFIYFEQGKIDQAIEEFNQAFEVDPQDASTHFGSGLCSYKKGEISQATEKFMRALELNPRHLQADYQLGLCYYKNKEFSQALRHFQQAIILDPQNKYVYYQLGQIYFEQKQYDLALNALKKSIEINPEMSGTHQVLGIIYLEQGKIDQAIEEFNQAFEVDPQDASTHFGSGLCSYKKGEISQATEKFMRALELNPRHLQADYQLGLCYYKNKEFSQALRHFQQAIILDPQNKYVYYQLGQIYFEQKQYDLALNALKKSIEINPEMSGTHQVLGIIYLEQGKIDQAIEEFNQAILLDADNIFCRQMLGYSYRKQAQFDLAIKESIKTANYCLEKEKLNKGHLEFRVKILRMPDFCYEIKDCPGKLQHTLLPPLALGQIVAYLRGKGIKIDQDDLNIEIHYDNQYAQVADKGIDITAFFDENRILRYVSGGEDKYIDTVMEEMEERSGLQGYGVILLSLREIYINASSLLFTLSLSRFLKKKYNSTLILGGSGQSIGLLSKYDCKDIDYVIYGEGETVLLRLLLALKDKTKLSQFLNSRIRNNGKLISTDLTDVYPPLKPDFSGLPMDKYRYLGFSADRNNGSCQILEEFDKSGTLLLPFKFIKGCPYECAFCSMAIDKSMHVLDPATVALYLKELQQEYNPTGFFFLSDTINISKQYVNTLCDAIIKNKTKILWSDCARADNLDRDTLFKMRQSGCVRLIFGIETASPRLLKYINKGIGVKRLEDTLKWSDEAGIWTGVEIICGLPQEQDSDTEATIAFLNKNKKYINTLYINQFDLRDGSTFQSQAKALGIENVSVINQYANEEFSNFHKYGYDEIGGLDWPEKKKQIANSYKKVLEKTEGNSFFGCELEHLLFFLYNKLGDKQKVCQAYAEIELNIKMRKVVGAEKKRTNFKNNRE